MEQKLLNQILVEITGLKTDVVEIKTDISVLKQEVSELKNDVSVLKEDVNGLKQEVSVLKTDMNKLEMKMNERFDRVYKEISEELRDMGNIIGKKMKVDSKELNEKIISNTNKIDKHRKGVKQALQELQKAV